MRFISGPQQRCFPVNDCLLNSLVLLHKNLILTNDTVFSRLFICGWCTVPIVGTAHWFDSLNLHHFAFQLSYSFCHCLLEATSPVFNNISITGLDQCWTRLYRIMSSQWVHVDLLTKTPVLHFWFLSMEVKWRENRDGMNGIIWFMKIYISWIKWKVISQFNRTPCFNLNKSVEKEALPLALPWFLPLPSLALFIKSQSTWMLY